MNHSTTVKVRFRQSTIEGQPGSIVYAVTHHRMVRQTTTDYRIYPDEWDSKRNRISDLNANGDRKQILNSISQHINWDMALLKKIISQLCNQPVDYTADDVISTFIQQSKERSFFSYLRRVITRLRQLNRNGTADNYQSALNSLTRFMQGEDLRFEQITSSLMEEYEAWLHKNGVSPNSSSFYFRNLRAVYRQAIMENLCDDQHPFNKVFSGVEKTTKRAITIDDIRKIKNVDLSAHPHLQLARDLFLFQFYAMGISFVDAVFLKKTNVKDGNIIYRRHKTNQLITVPINSYLDDLIKRFHQEESDYLLPVIDDIGCSPRKQYKSALRRINQNLKDIAKLCNIKANLTTYTTRHTWASVAKEKGIEISVISDALGHDNVRTTEIYLSTISNDKLAYANSVILSDL